MSYNFVSIITQTDNDVPVRQPLTSSDVLVSRGSVLTSISTAQSISTLSDVTGSTNLVSTDIFVSHNSILTFFAPGVSTITSVNSPLVTGGAYANNSLSTFISSVNTAGTTYTTTATLHTDLTST
jgi:hypothetical protein